MNHVEAGPTSLYYLKTEIEDLDYRVPWTCVPAGRRVFEQTAVRVASRRAIMMEPRVTGGRATRGSN